MRNARVAPSSSLLSWGFGGRLAVLLAVEVLREFRQ